MASNGTTIRETFTQRDMEIIVAAFQSLKAAPQVDYEELAKKAGFKNSKVASTIWSTLKKKYGIGGKAATPGVARTPTPRKRKNAANGNGFDASPSKKPKTPYQATVEDDDDKDEEKTKEELVKQEEA